MQALVTGGSGFIGRALLADLAARGVACVAPVRSQAAADVVAGLGARPVRLDLTDVEALTQAMAGCERVFHVAGDTRLWAPLAELTAGNVTATAAMLEAAKRAGVRRFVHVSSESVLVGPGPVVGADETWPIPAVHAGNYPATKAAAERLAQAANSDALAVITVRPPWVWGPGDTSNIPQFLRTIRSGAFRWVGDARHERTVCHVDNLVEGLWLAGERGRGGEAYFITDGEPVEFRAFMSRMMAANGAPIGDASMPRWVADLLAAGCEATWRVLRLAGQPPIAKIQLRLGCERLTMSDAKARRELGYQNRVSVEAGLLALEAARP